MEHFQPGKSLVIYCFLILLTACGGGGEPDTNSSGDEIGTNLTPISQLRKSITLDFITPNPDFSFGKAYLARISNTSNGVYWVVFAKNISSQAHCFIHMNKGVAKDSTGNMVLEDSFNYIDGSVRRYTVSMVETNTCLNPGETGVFTGIDILTGAYEKITHITYEDITVSASDTVEILPVVKRNGNYRVVNTSSISQELSLDVKNSGTGAGQVSLFSKYIMLDSNGEPLIWSYIDPEDGWDGILAVNQTGTLVDKFVFYDGVSKNISLFIDYGSPVKPLPFGLNWQFSKSENRVLNSAEFSKALNNQRNLMEAYKQSLISN